MVPLAEMFYGSLLSMLSRECPATVTRHILPKPSGSPPDQLRSSSNSIRCFLSTVGTTIRSRISAALRSSASHLRSAIEFAYISHIDSNSSSHFIIIGTNTKGRMILYTVSTLSIGGRAANLQTCVDTILKGSSFCLIRFRLYILCCLSPDGPSALSPTDWD